MENGIRQNPFRADSKRLGGKIAHNKPGQKMVSKKGGTLEKFQDMKVPVTVADKKRENETSKKSRSDHRNSPSETGSRNQARQSFLKPVFENRLLETTN